MFYRMSHSRNGSSQNSVDRIDLSENNLSVPGKRVPACLNVKQSPTPKGGLRAFSSLFVPGNLAENHVKRSLRLEQF